MFDVFQHKGLTEDTALSLQSLVTDLSALGMTAEVKQRGQFGNVIRISQGTSVWFDALPAKGWVLFYFGKGASRLPEFDFRRLSVGLPHAEQRKDGVVKVRLHNQHEVQTLVTYLRDDMRLS